MFSSPVPSLFTWVYRSPFLFLCSCVPHSLSSLPSPHPPRPSPPRRRDENGILDTCSLPVSHPECRRCKVEAAGDANQEMLDGLRPRVVLILLIWCLIHVVTFIERIFLPRRMQATVAIEARLRVRFSAVPFFFFFLFTNQFIYLILCLLTLSLLTLYLSPSHLLPLTTITLPHASVYSSKK